MSAQGATLRRGTAHLPVWPLAVLVAGAAAIVLAISLINVRPETPVRTVTEAERFANSSAAVREQGAAFPEVNPIPVTSIPSQWTVGQAEAYVNSLVSRAVGIENPALWTSGQAEAYVDSLVTRAVGIENPAVGISQVTEMTHPVGLENPSAYPAVGDGSFTPTMGARPGMTGGAICGQCR